MFAPTLLSSSSLHFLLDNFHSNNLRSSSANNGSCFRPSIFPFTTSIRVRRFSSLNSVGNGDGGGGRGGNHMDKGGGGEDGECCDDGGLFLSWYTKNLDSYPLLTNSVLSALLNLTGDLVCQVLVDQLPDLNFKRLSVVAFLGFALVGPTLHSWFNYLNGLSTLTGSSGTLIRLFIDQILFAPVFIGFFICSLVTLEGRPSLVMPMLQQEWFSSVIVNWQLWIPFQFLNFQFVPLRHQVLAANFVALAWNVILSFKTHREVIVK